jgi:hypothetical protein
MLQRENGVSTTEEENWINTALISVALDEQTSTCQLCLKQRGVTIATIFLSENGGNLDGFFSKNSATQIMILRFMVLRSVPTIDLLARLSTTSVDALKEGFQRRQKLAQRRIPLTDEQCPLIAPLQAIVLGYVYKEPWQRWSKSFGYLQLIWGDIL